MAPMPEDQDPEQLATWRAQALDAHVLGTPSPLAAVQQLACADWLAEAAPSDLAPALGIADVPEDWIDTLAWSGMPLAPGPLHWGVDIDRGEVDCPTLRDGRLLLPAPDDLASLTSLALKPLRLFIAERLHCRLQAAPSIRLWLWPGRAVLQSQSPIPLAGFLYGPPSGHRACLAMDPWGSQIITW